MNAEEFKQVFLPHHKVLYRVAYHLTGNVQDAEDLVQDLYLRLWMRRDKLDKERQTQAYLVTMIRNLYRDKARLKSPPILGEEITDEPPDTNTPEKQLIAIDSSSHIQQLVGNLPEKERKVIQMHADELGYKEMEDLTGLTQGNLRIIVMRTKQKLKQQFENISKTWKK